MNAPYSFSFSSRRSRSGASSHSEKWARASVYKTSEFWSCLYVLFSLGRVLYLARAYLFSNLSSVIINIPPLPKKEISWQVSMRCEVKFNPVDDNLAIIEKICLINLYISFQSFSSLGAKPIAPVIQAITNLNVY
jgi:hypothetical protein